MRILYIAWDEAAWRGSLVHSIQQAGHTLIPLYRARSINRYTFSAKAFLTALRTSFDVLLADFATFGYLGARICEVVDRPLVVYARGSDVDTRDPEFGARFNVNWVRYALNGAQVILAASRYIVDRIVELSPESRTRVRLVYNGVDINRFSQARHAQTFRLLDVGNILIRKKGLDTLIEALAEIGTRHPQIRLSIVGKDVAGEKRRLAALAEQLGVSDKVIFKGFVSDEQLIREYQTADIFVHAARQEQFGVVLLEAMASGLPVIGANACGIPEIIPEDSLVPVDDPDALARKTIRFLSLTDEERWRMGERNRLIVIDSFTSHRQGDEVLRFLEEAIEKHDKPTG